MSANIQIIGTKKCKETQKAERFFKERGIKFHFVDLNERALSKGEIQNIARNKNIEDLIDSEGKYYIENGYVHRVYDALEALLEYPELLKTPIVRFGNQSTIGNEQTIWKNWLKK